jgi:hypothetical protein
MSLRLRRRRARRTYSISKWTRRYALAMVWLVVAVGLFTASGLLAQFLPNANPSITIGSTTYTIPVTTIGEIVIGFIGLFALFKFIQLVGVRV